MKRALVALLLCGCPKAAPVATAEDAAVPSAAPSASVSPAGPQPLPLDATRADREKAVLALLRGTGASAISERATDPGKPFDRRLRDLVAPPRNVYLQQESVSVEGGGDKVILERRIRQSLTSYRGCYERALERQPALEGNMTLRFEVAANGTIGAVTDGGGGKPSAELVACAKTELAKIVIAEAKSSSKMTQTVRFSLSPIAAR